MNPKVLPMIDGMFVMLGGGIGAWLRYLISLLPCRLSFPLLTLLTNLLGALLIGFLSGLALRGKAISPRRLLFWKTGLCGGFTTFSTFSLEAYQLLSGGHCFLAAAYLLLSVIGCLAGVWAGHRLAASL